MNRCLAVSLPPVIAGLLMIASAGQAQDPAALGGNLSVVSVSPTAHVVDAAPGAPIQVVFDREVDPASVTTLSFWAFARWSGAVDGTRTLSPDGLTLTLMPDEPLSAGEQVMVLLSHDLMGTDATSLRTGGYSWQYWVRTMPTLPLVYEEGQTLVTGTPSRPYGGVGSDLDGDGFLDLTTINEDTDDVRVFMNLGDGSGVFDDEFSASTPSGDTPSPNEPADFNRDGHTDLVLANTTTASVSVLLGVGDGTFQTPQETAVTSSARGVAVLDVDGDGDVDIATADRDTSQISILRNDGTGAFGNRTSFGSGTDREWGLAAGDMDNDGILDLVAGSGNGGAGQSVWVYKGHGDGTFSLLDSRDIGTTTWMLVLGDVDEDGDADVSVASSSSVGVVVRNAGDGTLESHDTYGIDPFGLATDFGDLDGDGDLDWITSSFSGDWFVFLNDGTGTFVFDRELPSPVSSSCAVPLDVDNDGDLDLALVDEIANVVVMQINQGGPIFVDGFESSDLSAWSSSVP